VTPEIFGVEKRSVQLDLRQQQMLEMADHPMPQLPQSRLFAQRY
jgi:hypothetical protein